MAPRAPLSSGLATRQEPLTLQLTTSLLKEPPLTCATDNQSTPHANTVKENQRRRRRRCAIGSFVIGAVSVSAVLLLRYATYHHRCRSGPPATSGQRTNCDGGGFLSFASATKMHNSAGGSTIMDYLDLFRWSDHSAGQRPNPASKHTYNSSHQSNNQRGSGAQENRHLLGGDDLSHFPQLVVAGKMTVEGGPCNIAQFNLKTKEWSLTERIQLSLYNSYSGGEVYSLLANHTFLPQESSEEETDDSTSRYVLCSDFRIVWQAHI